MTIVELDRLEVQVLTDNGTDNLASEWPALVRPPCCGVSAAATSAAPTLALTVNLAAGLL